MLKHILTIYMIKRMASSNIYISPKEGEDILDNLNTGEHKVYHYLRHSPLFNRTPEEFKPAAIAAYTNQALKTVQNQLTSLKKKGYAEIVWFRDERNNQGVKVIVGKDQMLLYKLGLDVQITDGKQYNQILEKFDILNPTLSDTDRQELVKQANEYVKSLEVKGG